MNEINNLIDVAREAFLASDNKTAAKYLYSAIEECERQGKKIPQTINELTAAIALTDLGFTSEELEGK